MNQNLKPFDLQAALDGKPVCTRGGNPVTIAGYNSLVSEPIRIIGWEKDSINSWFENGRYLNTREDPKDLFMAPEVREHWCLFVQNKISKQYLWLEKTFPSKKEAEQFITEGMLGDIYKKIKVELSYTEELN